MYSSWCSDTFLPLIKRVSSLSLLCFSTTVLRSSKDYYSSSCFEFLFSPKKVFYLFKRFKNWLISSFSLTLKESCDPIFARFMKFSLEKSLISLKESQVADSWNCYDKIFLTSLETISARIKSYTDSSAYIQFTTCCVPKAFYFLSVDY